jgi:hypothetical protein
LTDKDLQTLEASWITPQLALSAGIERVDSFEGARRIGREKDGGSRKYDGLYIPYRLPGSLHERGGRLRRDTPDFERGDDGRPKARNKYLTAPGAANLLYFPPGVLHEHLKNPALPFVITEGEKKALALARLAEYESDEKRFITVGISGVWNWKGKTGREPLPNGEYVDVSGPIPDLDFISFARRKVVIVFDADATANESVAHAQNALARELRRRGAQVSIMNVPQEAGVKGVDDWLAASGPERVFAHMGSALANISSASGKPGGTSALISGEELYHREIEDLNPLVDGLLYEGLTILAGRPKSGKSWLALQLALGVIQESSFAGLRVHEGGKVLYLALEESMRRTHRRLHQLTAESDFLADLALLYQIPPLMNGGLEELEKHLSENAGIRVVIVDTYLALLQDATGKKNVVQEDYNSVNCLCQLAQKYHIALVLVHHTRKAAGNAVDSLLGTTGITAACDCIMTLERAGDSPDAVLRVTGREVEQQTLALRFNQDEADFGWRFSGSAESGEHVRTERKMSPQREEILKLLATEGPMEPWQVAEKLGKNASTVRRLLQEMLLAGLLEKDEQGRYNTASVNAMNGSERMNTMNSMNSMEEMEMSML